MKGEQPVAQIERGDVQENCTLVYLTVNQIVCVFPIILLLQPGSLCFIHYDHCDLTSNHKNGNQQKAPHFFGYDPGQHENPN